MKLVKFVKITKKSKNDVARELGYENEKDLLKNAEFTTMVGLWVDTDQEVEVEIVVGTLTCIPTIQMSNRCFGDNWYTTVFTGEVNLLVVEPGVGIMTEKQFETAFC